MKHIIAKILFVTLTWVASSAVAQTESANDTKAESKADLKLDPWVVLQKSASAARQLGYRGVFVYQSGDSSSAVQITHMNNGEKEYTHSIVLDGRKRELLSESGDLVIYNPKKEKVMVEKRHSKNIFPGLLPEDISLIKVGYKVKLNGMERTAGRDAKVIMLEPKDKYRYGYKLLTDNAYGLLLKAITLNEQNEPLEQIGFSQLDMLELGNLDWFQPSNTFGKSLEMEQARFTKEIPTANNWSLTNVPPGFLKVDQMRRIVRGKVTNTTQAIYSDGLAYVSLFIEPLPKGTVGKVGHTSVGLTHFYADIQDGYQIMAVGEVPEVTVTSLVKSVSFKK